MYIYVYICIHVYVYINVYVSICIHTLIHHMYTQTESWIGVPVPTKLVLHERKYIRYDRCVSVCVCTYVYVYAYMYVCKPCAA